MESPKNRKIKKHTSGGYFVVIDYQTQPLSPQYAYHGTVQVKGDWYAMQWYSDGQPVMLDIPNPEDFALIFEDVEHNRITAEKYLCIFTDREDILTTEPNSCIGYLAGYNETLAYPVITTYPNGQQYKHYEVLRVPGVRQPNFGNIPDLPKTTAVWIKKRHAKRYDYRQYKVGHLDWDLAGLASDIMEFIVIPTCKEGDSDE